MRQFSFLSFLIVSLLGSSAFVSASPKDESKVEKTFEQPRTQVLVSIAPQKFLVESIGRDKVDVEVIVPAGASPHSYEPSARQMMVVQKGQIWFRIGEGFETRLIPILGHCKIFDQRDGIELLPLSCQCSHLDAYDSHIWLSPKLLKQEAAQIAAVLSKHSPENKKYYKKNLQELTDKLTALDKKIGQKHFPKCILVSHPAFGYFCKEYGIEQLSIEMEGREPTPKYLAELIARARKENIATVYLQKQYNIRGGKKIAKELGAKTAYLDPYAENVISNIESLAELLSHECH